MALFPDHRPGPVPAAGPVEAPILLVGLAPGRHGAQRTGIPFVGDASGDLLDAALAAAGLDRAEIRITNAVRCWPPDNRPTAGEIATCGRFLAADLASAGRVATVTLGRLAHLATVSALARVPAMWTHIAVRNSRKPIESERFPNRRADSGRLENALGLDRRSHAFGHGAAWPLDDGRRLVAAYHPSRRNVATGRISASRLAAALMVAMTGGPPGSAAGATGTGPGSRTG